MKEKKVVIGMKNKIIIIIVIVAVAVLSFFIGKNINNWKNSLTKKEVEEKCIRSTVLLTNKEEASETSGTVKKFSESELNEIRNIFNSNDVKGKVKQLYPEARDVEITAVKDTHIISVLYVCDIYSDEECLDILNKYIEYFRETMNNKEYDNIHIVDKAELPPQTRIIEK